jgi:hypothetical protein
MLSRVCRHPYLRGVPAPDVTYLPRSWWTDAPSIGHRTPHSQYLGLAIHHTVFVMADWDGDGFLHGDLDDVRRYMERLSVARPDLGPDVPYSYIVFYGEDDNHGIVVEGRGPGRTGAHTAGFNSTRYGCAFAGNTMDQPITRGVIEAFREVGRRLHEPITAVRTFGHKDHSDKGTACPGTHLYARIGELQPPFHQLSNEAPQEDDMALLVQVPGDSKVWAITALTKRYVGDMDDDFNVLVHLKLVPEPPRNPEGGYALPAVSQSFLDRLGLIGTTSAS